MTRLAEPTSVGFRDVDSPSLRIYYPAVSPGGQNAPVVPIGTDAPPYRPVLFIHGQREIGEGGLCPQDITTDHKMWGPLLELSGRCGLVVIAVNVSDVNFDTAVGAQRALEGLEWARNTWDDRVVLVEAPVVVDPTQPPSLPRVGVIGHSWGAKAAAKLALDRQVRCLVGVSGTWDDNESNVAITSAKVPTLLIAATEEGTGTIHAAPENQPFWYCRSLGIRSRYSALVIGTSVRSDRAAGVVLRRRAAPESSLPRRLPCSCTGICTTRTRCIRRSCPRPSAAALR